MTYKTDVVEWALEQARLLREHRFSELDIEHIADEIEDVGKAEKREFAGRLSELLASLLLWTYLPGFRTNAQLRVIKERRKLIKLQLQSCPSLSSMLGDERWRQLTWFDAVASTAIKLANADIPEACLWSLTEVIAEGWLPAAGETPPC